MKTTDVTVRARVKPELKDQAVKILEQLGLSTTDAIKMLLHQIVLNNGLPFDIKIPNKETQKILKEVNQGKNLIRHNSLEDMFNDLDN